MKKIVDFVQKIQMLLSAMSTSNQIVRTYSEDNYIKDYTDEFVLMLVVLPFMRYFILQK